MSDLNRDQRALLREDFSSAVLVEEQTNPPGGASVAKDKSDPANKTEKGESLFLDSEVDLLLSLLDCGTQKNGQIREIPPARVKEIGGDPKLANWITRHLISARKSSRRRKLVRTVSRHAAFCFALLIITALCLICLFYLDSKR